MPLKYKLTYAISRVDSDATEVANECSLDVYPATAEGPFYGEDRYYVTHEILAVNNDDAIQKADDIIDESPIDIDVFSLKGPDGVEFYTEDNEDE
jgi:hypothetical protein